MTATIWTDSFGLSNTFVHCQVFHLYDLSGAWRSTPLERLILLEHSRLIVNFSSIRLLLLLRLSLNSASFNQILPWLLKLVLIDIHIVVFGAVFIVRLRCRC